MGQRRLRGTQRLAQVVVARAERDRGGEGIPRRRVPSRRLLGVGEGATLQEIRDAHRRLISRVHPDTGGSAELAHRVNAARDTLVAEMNRKPPRAS